MSLKRVEVFFTHRDVEAKRTSIYNIVRALRLAGRVVEVDTDDAGNILFLAVMPLPKGAAKAIAKAAKP